MQKLAISPHRAILGSNFLRRPVRERGEARPIVRRAYFLPIIAGARAYEFFFFFSRSKETRNDCYRAAACAICFHSNNKIRFIFARLRKADA